MKPFIVPVLAGLIVIYASMALADHGRVQPDSTDQTQTPMSALSADELVTWILKQNAGLAELRAAVEADRARSEYAGELPDPMVSAAIAPETLGGYETPSGRDRGTNVRLEISQRLPWPGKLALRTRAAQSDVAVAEQSVDRLRLVVSEQARQAYAEWAYVHEALRINEKHQSLLDELRASAEARYAAGLANQQDVLQAEVKQQHLKHQRIRLQRLQRAIQARINALLNRTEQTLLGEPEPLVGFAGLPTYESLSRAALKQHPDLIRIANQIDGNSIREELAEKDFYPDLNVFTGYSGLWDDPSKRWVVGAGINVPINRDKYHSRLDEVRAGTQRLRYALTDEKARLLSELDQAYAAAVEADHNLALYRDEILPLSAENLSAAQAAYGSGGGAFSDVIDAEQVRLMAQLETQRALADAYIARAAIARWAAVPPTTFNSWQLDAESDSTSADSKDPETSNE